jgi:O-acetylhomoserine (thiol)-lyase
MRRGIFSFFTTNIFSMNARRTNMNNLTQATKCVQGGYTAGNGEPRQVPIIQSTTFRYESSSDMGKLFDLEASGYFYS